MEFKAWQEEQALWIRVVIIGMAYQRERPMPNSSKIGEKLNSLEINLNPLRRGQQKWKVPSELLLNRSWLWRSLQMKLSSKHFKRVVVEWVSVSHIDWKDRANNTHSVANRKPFKERAHRRRKTNLSSSWRIRSKQLKNRAKMEYPRQGSQPQLTKNLEWVKKKMSKGEEITPQRIRRASLQMRLWTCKDSYYQLRGIVKRRRSWKTSSRIQLESRFKTESIKWLSMWLSKITCLTMVRSVKRKRRKISISQDCLKMLSYWVSIGKGRKSIEKEQAKCKEQLQENTILTK